METIDSKVFTQLVLSRNIPEEYIVRSNIEPLCSLKIECDGFTCGEGKRFSRVRNVCPHNNLKFLYPELCKEWDHENNSGSPEEYLVCDKIVSWKCKNDPCGCHIWQTSIAKRVHGSGNGKPQGCPYCSNNNKKVCGHNNLEFLHPELAKEWVSEKNKKSPKDYVPKSGALIWWKCSKSTCECHVWQAPIIDRINGRGCPFCASKQICTHDSFAAKFPSLLREWDFAKNQKLPTQVSPSSHEVVWWICRDSVCGCHQWEDSPYNRARKLSCPYCSSRRICPHNNLKYFYPEIAEEWNDGRNERGPETYAPKSSEIVWWICEQGHEWKAAIDHRTREGGGTGCAQCSNNGQSKGQKLWLKSIMDKYGIVIQTCMSIEGELKIAGVGKVDGFHAESNTVFEYHGDYWHGNPKRFDPSKLNRRKDKTFGELYRETMERDDKIRALGYNLVVMWEYDFLLELKNARATQ